MDGIAAKGVINVTGTAEKGATVDVADVATDGNSVTALYAAKVGTAGDLLHSGHDCPRNQHTGGDSNCENRRHRATGGVGDQ